MKLSIFDFITFCSTLPNVKVTKTRDHSWKIQYKKNGTRYAWDWDIWNHVKFMYETIKHTPVTTDDVHLRVFSKYILISFS